MDTPQQRNLFTAETLPPPPMPWEVAAESDRLAAEVVFNLPLETAFHYLVPDELRDMLQPGQRVKVPFGQGNRAAVGYCVSIGPPPVTTRKLKAIEEVLDREPLLDARMLSLTHWIAERYLCSWGQVLQTVVPAGVKKKAGTRLVNVFQVDPDVRARRDELHLPAKQQAVLDLLLAATEPLRIEEICERADCGTGPVNALRDKGLIRAVRQRTSQFSADFGAVDSVADLVLNTDQGEALDQILDILRRGVHETVLLHGVTGSGKTEIYMQAIREVVAYGRQAIVLVPEISLTPQTIRRFRSRFDSVAVLHSHLTDSERHWHWQQIARGAVQVVIGARSAIFAPTPQPGLIVIDEEHETSFKQDTAPRYHAREVARERARLEGIPLILGSATPTLESWQRVHEKHDRLISLANRIEGLPLPPVVVVDIRHDPQISHGAAIGRVLHSAMRGALADNGQIILFLNLRGHSPALWCRQCGTSIRCENCDITLTWHRDRNIVLCHSCDFRMPPPERCPSCAHPGVRYLGIGTQRLEQEVKAKFSGVACLRMDSDSMRKRGSHDEALEAFRHGQVQILLGTQMIAKGLDFPNVTLVGVISADTILHQPDLRAAERTFQLIAQVAGRTGRSARGGRVYVQTSSPTEPPIVQAAQHDYQTFARAELKHRHDMLAPPYHHWTRIVLRGPDEETVRQHAQAMAELLRAAADAGQLPVRILGPAPAPVTKLKGLYRYHFQLAAEHLLPIQQLWHAVAEQVPRTQDVEYIVDVDPINMR